MPKKKKKEEPPPKEESEDEFDGPPPPPGCKPMMISGKNMIKYGLREEGADLKDTLPFKVFNKEWDAQAKKDQADAVETKHFQTWLKTGKSVDAQKLEEQSEGK